MFFFNDTATTEIYTLSLHDALPILRRRLSFWVRQPFSIVKGSSKSRKGPIRSSGRYPGRSFTSRVSSCRNKSRSEEHTSELQSRQYLVCRLLLEKNTNDRF